MLVIGGGGGVNIFLYPKLAPDKLASLYIMNVDTPKFLPKVSPEDFLGVCGGLLAWNSVFSCKGIPSYNILLDLKRISF